MQPKRKFKREVLTTITPEEIMDYRIMCAREEYMHETLKDLSIAISVALRSIANLPRYEKWTYFQHKYNIKTDSDTEIDLTTGEIYNLIPDTNGEQGNDSNPPNTNTPSSLH